MSASNDKKVDSEVITINELFNKDGLTIPEYQRPYKWTEKNVLQLIRDINIFKNKSAYRLGTVVLHKEEALNKPRILNIVDGQQRIITLRLIITAILENEKIKDKVENINLSKFDPTFSNSISCHNIQQNYKIIKREVAKFDKETVEFLLNKCQVVLFVLQEQSEAFQFFDSQNSRGKPLEAHDLLKAFHLREFSVNELESEKIKAIENWESFGTKDLSKLFTNLFRVKNWSRGVSAREFTKNDIDLFKGVNLENNNYNFTKSLAILDFFTNSYSNYEKKIHKTDVRFPFQLDQIIINGKRFFEMVSHYKELYDNSKNKFDDNEIIKIINEYDGMYRTGDKYVRMIFDCALLFYIDKFSDYEINKAIEIIFIWAYSLRVKSERVMLSSIDKYILEEINMFKIIKEAIEPYAVFSIMLPLVEIRATNIGKVELKFKEFGYVKK